MLDLGKYADDDMGELGVAPEDEYDIQLVKFMTDDQGEVVRYYGDEDNLKPYLLLKFQVIDHPDADNFKDFTYFLGLPNDDDDGKQKKIKLNKIKNLGDALDINFFEELDPLDYNGKVSCSAILTISESDSHGEQNEIKQILIPR